MMEALFALMKKKYAQRGCKPQIVPQTPEGEAGIKEEKRKVERMNKKRIGKRNNDRGDENVSAPGTAHV